MFGATPRGEVTLDEQWLFEVARTLFYLVGCCVAGIVECSVSGAALRGVVTLEHSRHRGFIGSGSEVACSCVIIRNSGGYHVCICLGALLGNMTTSYFGKRVSGSICGGNSTPWSSSMEIKAQLAFGASFPVSSRFCISENLNRERSDFFMNSKFEFAKFDFLV